MSKFLAIDGNSLVNRAFYGIKYLSNSSGFPTNAIFGFYNILDKILKEDSFSYVVAAFDVGASTFRHKKFEEYKANRKKMPEDLAVQFPEIKEMLKFLGITVLEKEGFEADDLLGTVSNLCYNEKIDCVIATGDRDSFQLIREGIVVRLSSNTDFVYYDEKKIIEKFGVGPKSLIEVKALMGDSSDNIPGVRGIGEKTALKLITEFKSVDYIFENIENLNISSRVKALLTKEGAEESCKLSRELGRIDLNVPIDGNIELFRRREIDRDGLIEFLNRFELKKILSKYLDFDCEKKEDEPKHEEVKIFKDANFSDVLNALEDLDYLDFYFGENGNLFIVSLEEVFEFENLKLEAFKEIILKSGKPKRTSNLNGVLWFCENNGLKIENVVFSCNIAAYLLDVLEKSYELEDIAKKYCPFDCLPRCFPNLCSLLSQKIDEQNLNFLFEKVEMPLAFLLFEMEKAGFKIDLGSLKNFGDFLENEIADVKNNIYEFCGEEFNINSTKELGRILFEKLKLKVIKKTKTGYSTDVSVLEKLIKYSPVALMVIKFRELSKLQSTYVKGLVKAVKPDGRVHSSFNQTQTRTGRISSVNPNIQNIPVKTEIGSEMRNFFVAENGKVLVDADYSQIELRILAHVSCDLKMIDAFKLGKDIHSITASEIFGFSYEKITAEARRRAKIVNFSVIYGVSAFSLSKDLGVSISKSKEYIDSFFEGYSSVKKYFEKTVEEAKQTKIVKTLFGRIRKVEEFNSKNKNIRLVGERIAKNTPIQGSCADIIKIAIINVEKRLRLERLNARLILQVYDELLVECDSCDCEKVAKILKEEMENAVSLKVPLVANVCVGRSWGEAKKVLI